jgi:hypothetical protein
MDSNTGVLVLDDLEDLEWSAGVIRPNGGATSWTSATPASRHWSEQRSRREASRMRTSVV